MDLGGFLQRRARRRRWDAVMKQGADIGTTAERQPTSSNFDSTSGCREGLFSTLLSNRFGSLPDGGHGSPRGCLFLKKFLVTKASMSG